MATDFGQVALAINIGTLAAVVYCLRIIILIDRKISKLMQKQGLSDTDLT